MEKSTCCTTSCGFPKNQCMGINSRGDCPVLNKLLGKMGKSTILKLCSLLNYIIKITGNE